MSLHKIRYSVMMRNQYRSSPNVDGKNDQKFCLLLFDRVDTQMIDPFILVFFQICFFGS